MFSRSRNRLSFTGYFAVILFAAMFIVYLASCSQEKQGPPKPRTRPTRDGTLQKIESQIDIQNAMAVIETAKGMIEVEFFADVAPKTVANFIKNARSGYYRNETFHRVEPGLLIQAGSRLVSETIPIESSDHKPVRGMLAMAKEQGETVADASEFFICLDTLELDSDYTLFGKVTKGLDVMDNIKPGDKIVKVFIREKG